MRSLNKSLRVAVCGALLGFSSSVAFAAPVIAITEWMYQGGTTNVPAEIGEFVEFTNMSGGPIDMTGWSFDDNSQTPGSESLSSFGIVAAGESVIFTDDVAATFRSRWGLAPSVKIIGGNLNNLSRADEINLYDNFNALIDRLTYDDATIAGTPRTRPASGGSGGPLSDAVLGTNSSGNWRFMNAGGDPHGVGFTTTGSGEVGNPGKYLAVPEPTAIGLICSIGLLVSARRRHA